MARFWAKLAWLLASLALLLTGRLGAAPNPPAEINPPVGTNIYLTPASFTNSHTFATNDRVVLTPYFYWYDSYSGAHLTDPDGSDALTDHPSTLTGFSYLSRAWHRTQLEDMTTAGIDVLLPVYWGEPSQVLPGKPAAAQPWSYAGLPPLVAAREELLGQGKRPPAIGMFYDTSTLMFNASGERIDLTTPRGREWFYESVRDFFSLIPPKHWAMIGGQPVVFLYSANFAAAHDQSCIDYLSEAFARDFGGRTPFVVRESSWQVRTANVYTWGGALGLKNPGVASLGPGYDHSAVPDRAPLIVPRENGAFFERNWLAFLRRPSKLVMVETWNEFHEGTDIAHSREYGEQYLMLNRKYVDLFRQGYVPPPAIGPFTGAHLVSIELAATNRPHGITQFEGADGTTAPATLGGRESRILTPTQYSGHYLYARLDESFKWVDEMDLVLVADYFDAAAGTLQVEFDGSDPTAPFQGAYTLATPTVALTGSQTWKTASFRLPRARLLNRENGGADFRLNSSILGLGLSRVQIVRPGLTVTRAQPGPALNISLTIWGEPGASYALQTSPDLLQWREISRLRLTSVSHDFTDQAISTDRTHYYRLVPQ